MKEKILDYTLICRKCEVECESMEFGIMCPKCGAYISDEELDEPTC